MPPGRDQYKSSYAAFAARERDLERSRARHDARDPSHDPQRNETQPEPTAGRPSP